MADIDRHHPIASRVLDSALTTESSYGCLPPDEYLGQHVRAFQPQFADESPIQYLGWKPFCQASSTRDYGRRTDNEGAIVHTSEIFTPYYESTIASSAKYDSAIPNSFASVIRGRGHLPSASRFYPASFSPSLQTGRESHQAPAAILRHGVGEGKAGRREFEHHG